jgi:hypothetical protein
VDQLNPITIDHAQQTWFDQKGLRPGLMAGKQSKQSSALRQFGEETVKIPFQPTLEGPIANSFERKQHSQGDNLTRIKVRLVVFAGAFHLIVNAAEQVNDKIFCSHEVSPFVVSVTTYSLENLMTFVN